MGVLEGLGRLRSVDLVPVLELRLAVLEADVRKYYENIRDQAKRIRVCSHRSEVAIVAAAEILERAAEADCTEAWHRLSELEMEG